ncbi:alkaline shock response membrane anchor protein AmaP [Streptomyces sp. NPDC056835]|uniref:alkaline shock response membrane anchor protein AmaP n=1 Tax=Streptomyces sp. NPDC056835 TaxID=3345956 RepID=UPI0036B57F9A
MREHTKTNRILLVLLGLVLLGGGLLTLAAGADLYRRWGLTPPAGWPLTTPQDVLIPRADQARWADQAWWWPTVIAALALLILLALTWLLCRHRRWRPRQLPVAGTPRKAVSVNDHALNDALTTDLTTLPGTRRSRARVSGPPTHPQALIALTLAPGITPEHVLEDVSTAVERARQSAGWDQLPSLVRLDVSRHGPRRAE